MKCEIFLFLIIFVINKIKGDDILLNVTYENENKDVDEESRFILESEFFLKKVKLLGKKYSDNIDILKQMLIFQLNQIQKLNDVVLRNDNNARMFLYNINKK
jgi:hypothetical protein